MPWRNANDNAPYPQTDVSLAFSRYPDAPAHSRRIVLASKNRAKRAWWQWLKTMSEVAERDWKYLRSIEAELLEELARRTNDEIRAVLARADASENDKRREIYDIVKKQDRVVTDCFGDWRRSRLIEHCWVLYAHGVLKPEHLARVTPELRRMILPDGKTANDGAAPSH